LAVSTVFSVCHSIGCVDGILGLSPRRLPHCGCVSPPLSPFSRSQSWFVISGRSEVRIVVWIPHNLSTFVTVLIISTEIRGVVPTSNARQR
jgi:hypothetical protein